MSPTGLESITPQIIFTDALGPVVPLSGFGYRLNVSPAINGNDIWPGIATTLPIPADIGEQMSIVSTSSSDSSSGTGARIIQIDYLDNNGDPNQETITMNGTTTVNTLASNIRFVQEINVIDAGSNLLALGTITIFKTGTPTQIYSQIQSGTNQSLNASRMVPKGKILLITQFNCSGAASSASRFIDVRLRITSHGGTLLPKLFHFADNFFVSNNGTNRRYDYPLVVPSLGIVKCTSYVSVSGGDVQTSWQGILVNTPI